MPRPSTSRSRLRFRDSAHAADLVERLGDAVVPMTGLLRVSDDPLQDAVAWLLQLDAPGRRAVAAAAASAAHRPCRTPTTLGVGPRLRRPVPRRPDASHRCCCTCSTSSPAIRSTSRPGTCTPTWTGRSRSVAASDNVLRGNTPEARRRGPRLLHVLRFEPGVSARPRTVHQGDRLRYDAGETCSPSPRSAGLDGS
ncbi:MAG: hypothetical protein R2711_04045 [Acidimicrobiales bacterium]